MAKRWRAVAVAAATAAALLPGLSGNPADAAFPGRNGRLLCGSGRDGNNEVYSFNPDGSDPRRLTNNPASDFEPTSSPDGTRIAFTSTREGDQEIYVMYADGSGVRRLTIAPGEDRPGSWSPDGTQIAFQSSRFGVPPGSPPTASSLEIMKMNADGSNPVRLTTNVAQDSFAHWSPLGDRIAFTTNRDDNFEIYTMATDGSSPTRITNSPGEDAHAQWSPDAAQFVLHSRRDFPTPTATQIEIYRINAADGSGAVRLTNDDVFDAFPVWSPDGASVAWSRFFPSDVFVADASDATPAANITNHPADDTRCDWARLLPCTVTGAGVVNGTAGDDVICASAGSDRIDAGGGNDVVYAGAGSDTILAGAGNDIVFGDRGSDRIDGGTENDTLFGDQDGDVIDAGPGNDIASGSEGADAVNGNTGTDECYGESLSACP